MNKNNYACKGSECESKLNYGENGIASELRKKIDELEIIIPELQITSGYRCPVHNALVSGFPTTSRHMNGTCADVTAPGLLSNLRKAVLTAGIESFGVYVNGGFIHCDTEDVGGEWQGDAEYEINGNGDIVREGEVI